MQTSAERPQGKTAEEWYGEAVRCYVDEHQGCPCCGARHCVFRSRWGARVEYHCGACDFSAAHDAARGGCTASRGDLPPGAGLDLSRDPD
jgi:hypothetical protein